MNQNTELAGLRSAIRLIFARKGDGPRDRTPSNKTGPMTALGYAGVLLASAPAAWANITYNINLNPDSSVHVTGAITTNGTTGSLVASNFVGFDLHASVNGLSADLVGTTPSCGPCGLTATASQLLIDPTTVELGFFDSPAFLSVSNVDATRYNIALFISDPFGSESETVSATGPVVFGAAVPEPGTAALTALAFAALAAARRRRQPQKTTSAT